MRFNNEAIDFALARKGWGIGDLAESMGMSRTAVYYQRHKVKRLRPSTVGKMAKALGVPVEEIAM